ncbi:hypothetical protein ACP70R_038232 [Stipagrostis hirtigluma subsp. patula]
MRREGRQHGWVYTVDRSLVDPEGKRRAVHTVAGPTANGGFVRAPRKPTNHSKSTGGGGKAGGAAASSGKGRHKFKHDEVKMYYLDIEGADDAAIDVYDMNA